MTEEELDRMFKEWTFARKSARDTLVMDETDLAQKEYWVGYYSGLDFALTLAEPERWKTKKEENKRNG